jgi:hypothetical protein
LLEESGDGCAGGELAGEAAIPTGLAVAVAGPAASAEESEGDDALPDESESPESSLSFFDPPLPFLLGESAVWWDSGVVWPNSGVWLGSAGWGSIGSSPAALTVNATAPSCSCRRRRCGW